jgi:hypothetical protein
MKDKLALKKVQVVLTHNPSYLGGRDQEDHGSKPTRANSSRRPYLEKPFTKKGWCGGPEFKPQYCKK